MHDVILPVPFTFECLNYVLSFSKTAVAEENWDAVGMRIESNSELRDDVSGRATHCANAPVNSV